LLFGEDRKLTKGIVTLKKDVIWEGFRYRRSDLVQQALPLGCPPRRGRKPSETLTFSDSAVWSGAKHPEQQQ
jgi:hypothetical protein